MRGRGVDASKTLFYNTILAGISGGSCSIDFFRVIENVGKYLFQQHEYVCKQHTYVSLYYVILI